MGIFSLEEALFKAKQQGLDLVEVAANTNPPVCKIVDFKKFLYLQNKKAKLGKKKDKQELKEIRITPFIAQKDFEIRINKAKAFLGEGHKVKITVKFVGRQISRKEFGYELLNRAFQSLKEQAKIEDEPKFIGKMLSQTFSPLKNKK